MLLSLVSCDVTATPKDNILVEFSYGSVVVTADEVFNKYLQTKDGVEAVYEQIDSRSCKDDPVKDCDFFIHQSLIK
jgi:hypothetical protein